MSKKQPPKLKAEFSNVSLGGTYSQFTGAQTQRHYTRSRHIQGLLVSFSNAKRKGKYIEGREFFCIKQKDTVEPAKNPFTLTVAVGGNQGRVTLNTLPIPNLNTPKSTTGPFTDAGSFTFPSPNPDFSQLVTDGAIGWNRARPGNPLVDPLVTGGEALGSNGLPGIPGLDLLKSIRSRTGLLRSVGKEYLNIQFGWAPLVNDIRKLLEFRDKVQKELDFIIRNNGKRVRRRRIVRSTISSSATVTSFTGMGAFWPPIPYGGAPSGSSSVTVQTITSEHTWFVGAFRFYTPPERMMQDGWLNGVKRRLAGENLTPDVVWNLMPWSWLVDWFTNAGDVMSNLSANAVDNLVADYAYCMSTKVTWQSTMAVGTFPSGTTSGLQSGPWSGSAQYITQTVKKMRYPASPYGFGFTWEGLSPYRASILAALGISRARF